MRIAIANWSRRIAGGVETYLADVVPALAGLGHELALITELDEPVDRAIIGNGRLEADLCVRSLGMSASVESLTAWQPDVIYLHQMQELELERRLSEIAPVVAFAHAYYGTCISGTKTHRLPSAHPCSRQLGPGCLVHYFPNRCGGLNPVTMMRLYQQQSARLEQMRRYFRVVTFSDHMAREYRKHGISATRLWEESVSGDAYRAVPRSAPSADASWNLMFLGRFELLKGAEVLLDSLRVLAAEGSGKISLRLVGDGTERRGLERKAAAIMADTKQLLIDFPGWLTGDELESEWDRAHALVMPSIWPEPFGLAGIEAGRRGLPVVAFEVGAIPEWLEGGRNGVLARLGVSRALSFARALKLLMSDPAVYASMSEAAPRMAERFSLQHHLEPLSAVLKLAAASAGRKAS